MFSHDDVYQEIVRLQVVPREFINELTRWPRARPTSSRGLGLFSWQGKLRASGSVLSRV